MAKLSRNARGKARAKRTLSQTRRALREAQAQGIKTHMMLLGVLAQCGGEKVVTVGTLQQVNAAMAWSIGPVEGGEQGLATTEYVVRLVMEEKEAPGDMDSGNDLRDDSLVDSGMVASVADSVGEAAGPHIETIGYLGEATPLPADVPAEVEESVEIPQ